MSQAHFKATKIRLKSRSSVFYFRAGVLTVSVSKTLTLPMNVIFLTRPCLDRSNTLKELQRTQQDIRKSHYKRQGQLWLQLHYTSRSNLK